MATQGRTQRAPADEHRSTNEIMDGIRSIVRALRVNTRSIEMRLGISLAQLWVLQLLEGRPSQSVNDLAEATATHQSSVSVVVRRLVDRGLVTRTMAVEDRRRVRVDITDAGRDLLRTAPPTVQVTLLGALRRMAAEPRQNLANLMRSWLTDAGLDLSERPPMLMEDTRRGCLTPRRDPDQTRDIKHRARERMLTGSATSPATLPIRARSSSAHHHRRS